MSTKKNQEKQTESDIAVEISLNHIVQTEGEKASQILQAYEGVRYDSKGNNLNHKGRSLKDIKNYKINKDYAEQNIKQQSGFSAELIHEARVNKKHIANGDSSRLRTSDGIGNTNDTRFDHVLTDKNGAVIEGSGSQMKFYGTNPKNGKTVYKVADKIANDESWDRYNKITVPKEQLDGAKEYARSRSEELTQQAERAKKSGNTELYEKKLKQANRYEQSANKMTSAELTSDEAKLARINPELFTGVEMLGDIAHAGTEAMKGAACAGLTFSVAQNLYGIASGEKDLNEAIKDVSITVSKSAAEGFGVGALGSAAKSLMHTSKSEIIRRCGTGTLPTGIASSTIEAGKSIYRYASGKINEEQLLIELGNKGVGMLASQYGAAILGCVGSAILPGIGTLTGLAIGELVGSIVGYTASSILYSGALNALAAARISNERRIFIQGIVRKSIDMNNKYIDNINKYLYRSELIYRTNICGTLNKMRKCIFENDFDGYISSIDFLAQNLGIDLEIKTYAEFDAILSDKSTALKL